MRVAQLGMKVYGKQLDDKMNHHCEKINNNLLGLTAIDLKFRHKQPCASLDDVSPKR